MIGSILQKGDSSGIVGDGEPLIPARFSIWEKQNIMKGSICSMPFVDPRKLNMVLSIMQIVVILRSEVKDDITIISLKPIVSWEDNTNLVNCWQIISGSLPGRTHNLMV